MPDFGVYGFSNTLVVFCLCTFVILLCCFSVPHSTYQNTKPHSNPRTETSLTTNLPSSQPHVFSPLEHLLCFCLCMVLGSVLHYGDLCPLLELWLDCKFFKDSLSFHFLQWFVSSNQCLKLIRQILLKSQDKCRAVLVYIPLRGKNGKKRLLLEEDDVAQDIQACCNRTCGGHGFPGSQLSC